jgi:3-phosphoshikimate 1-carboxyvinyltransferase
MDSLQILPLTRAFDAEVCLPGSKSITNRALLIAALASGRSRLKGALFSDDTRYMLTALQTLGLKITSCQAECWFEVEGLGGDIPVSSADLYVGNAGTAARFLTAFVALGNGVYRIDGVERMRQRPIGDLIEAMCALGVDSRTELGTGCPPVEVCSKGIAGGKCRIRGSASSQFLSALLLVAPYAGKDVLIEIEGELVSKPYADMTIKMMAEWGVKATNDNYKKFTISAGQKYQAQDYQIEPDASAASYFFAAAAVTGSVIRTPGLGAASMQGDVRFVNALEQMGCKVKWNRDCLSLTGPERLKGIDIDMNEISDTVMTLASIAPFADTPTSIRNVAHIRNKETDRLSAISTELGKLGVRVDERSDGLTVYPASQFLPAQIDTYGDHRMAMSFTITGLRIPGIFIKDPGCVSKTFPNFYECLDKVTKSN